MQLSPQRLLKSSLRSVNKCVDNCWQKDNKKIWNFEGGRCIYGRPLFANKKTKNYFQSFQRTFPLINTPIVNIHKLLIC